MSELHNKIGLRRWLWRAYVQSALLPLVLVETVLIACYLLSNQAIRDAQVQYLEQNAMDSLSATADQNAQIIQDHMGHVAANTDLFAHMVEQALANPAHTPPERFATTADGARYSPRNLGGAASFYSAATPLEKQDLGKVGSLASLDSLMEEMKNHQPLVASLYFNSWDNYNRIFPWFETQKQYPHNMRIPEYSFYYLADAAHNPGRLQRWTDVYLDPAGQGWMTSSISPVYRGDFLEGVVGMDVTVGGILEEISRLPIGWGGYLILVNQDMNIMALPHAAEHDFDLQELTGHGTQEAVKSERFKPADFNLGMRPDTADLAKTLAKAPNGRAEIDLKGRTHLVAWNEIQPSGWRLVALADRSEVMAATNNLAGHYRHIGYLLIAGLVGFYLCFFTYMWLRARHLSDRLRDAIDGIADMLRQIGLGQWQPRRAESRILELDRMAESVLVMGQQLGISENQRNAAQQRLELVAESVTAGLWEYDLEQDRLHLRGEFVARFNLPGCELLRHRLHPHIHPDDAPRLDSALNALRLGVISRIDLELRFLAPDGSEVWMLCRGRKLELEGEATHTLVAGTFVDIEKLKQVEEDLLQRTREAQAASQAKSRFISSISHELRTPLNAIHGFAQLMHMQATQTGADTQSLDEILLASGHLSQLVDDLLDWSSLQAEAPKLTLRPVNAGRMMHECAEMVRGQAETVGLELQVRLPEAPTHVMADSRRLRQVLINLLSNAIKYNRPGGRLLLGVEPCDEHLRIYVEDGGEGLDPALQGELFEPFQRLGKENTAIKGTGIGLSLCRELAELMQGRMGLHSELGVGSRFWIELPLANTPSSVGRVERSGRPRVIHLDDDEPSRRRVARALAGVADVASLDHGGQLAEALQQGLPDMLLVDLGVDGASAISQLNGIEGGADVPVVMLTAKPDPSWLSFYAFRAVLLKPIDVEELRELASSLLVKEEPHVH